MTATTLCAAPNCTTHGEHYNTCTNPTCTGCWPRTANHGHLCQTHYERADHALQTIERLRTLDTALHQPINNDKPRLAGHGYAKAVTPTIETTTVAGPRVPLTPLQLDLEAIDRALADKWHTDRQGRQIFDRPGYRGDLNTWISTIPGATDAAEFARLVHNADRNHPTQEHERKLHRLRCPNCNQATATWQPPTWPGDDVHITCLACHWQATNPNAIDIVTHIETRGAA